MTVRRLLARGIAVVSLSACTHVVPVPSPLQYITARHPDRVWVTRSVTDGGATVQLSQPRARGDTLVGLVGETLEAIPVAAVAEVRARQAAPRRTVALVAVPFATLGLYDLVASALRPYQVPPVGIPGGGGCFCNLDSICC